MDSIDYAQKLSKEFGVDLSDAIKAIDCEADDLKADKFHAGRTAPYSRRIETAYEHVATWLREGHEYVVNLTYADMAQFTFSHRKACVWAVLTAKAKKSA